MASIDELIKELERHKVKFVPNKQTYLDFMFEFVYQLTSLNDRSCKVSQSNQFIPRMKDFLEEDFHYVKQNYYKNNHPYIINVPPKHKAKEYAVAYDKRGWIVPVPSHEQEQMGYD